MMKSIFCCCPCLKAPALSKSTAETVAEDEETDTEGFNFKENSKAMFDDVCNASPKLVRHFTRDALVKGLKDHGCGDVYESTMYEVCREVTPKKYMDKTIAILDKDKTT